MKIDVRQTNMPQQSRKECEMNTKPEGGTLRLTTVNNPQTYLIAVDGQQGDYGNFRLTINCKTYR